MAGMGSCRHKKMLFAAESAILWRPTMINTAKYAVLLAAVALITPTVSASADELKVPVNAVSKDGVGGLIGDVTLTDTEFGLKLTPMVAGLPPGLHGLHVHENPSCVPGLKNGEMAAAAGAGGHYDPQHSARHEGPYGAGHMGDIPPLYVGQDGRATLPLLAPRLKVADIKGRALIIHQGGDNYSDQPLELGGGGSRIACGVIPK
jgi:superoxide dismutase, Cu-Zn family